MKIAHYCTSTLQVNKTSQKTDSILGYFVMLTGE